MLPCDGKPLQISRPFHIASVGAQTFRMMSLLFALLLILGSPSECLTVPAAYASVGDGNHHRHDRTSIGHPALLDAISNFHPTSPDACRVFHGRGGLFEGADHLTLDYYPPVFLLTSFEELDSDELGEYGDALSALWDEKFSGRIGASGILEPMEGNDLETAVPLSPPLAWVYQCRAQRGKSTTEIMSGEVPEPHIVTENSGQNKYLVHLARGQNHGLFLDMAAGRQWLQNKCMSGTVGSVLNLFAYTCAFSVAALNGGAETVVNVDMSHGALKIGQRNHELNEKKGGAKFLGHDLFKSWGKLKRLGPYDCVVVDPPSYQKGSFVASKDYIKVIRRLPSLLNDNGWALLCLNAPELDTDFLLRQVEESGASELCFVERLENPPTFASAFPERALKVLAFQYRPQ